MQPIQQSCRAPRMGKGQGRFRAPICRRRCWKVGQHTEETLRARNIPQLVLSEVLKADAQAAGRLLLHAGGNADAARVRHFFNPGGNIYAVTENAALISDNIAKVDADTKMHAALRFDRCIALGHGLLDGERALNRLHDTCELGEYPISGGVDDAPLELSDHRKHHSLVTLEVSDRARLVPAHQGAIASDVRRQDCCEFARLRHGGLPIFPRQLDSTPSSTGGDIKFVDERPRTSARDLSTTAYRAPSDRAPGTVRPAPGILNVTRF